jgi:hypothetical protein
LAFQILVLTMPATEKTKSTLPTEAVRLAKIALAQHPECFWTRRAGTPVQERGDVDLIIRRLRQNGGRTAWKIAREIERCL